MAQFKYLNMGSLIFSHSMKHWISSTNTSVYYYSTDNFGNLVPVSGNIIGLFVEN